MLKGGVIMDVVTPDQARLAEEAGAVAVMALERVPSDIRAQGGVARTSDPDLIEAVGAGVDALARLPDGRPVATRQGQYLATAFHPELTDDLAWHRYFVTSVTG